MNFYDLHVHSAFSEGESSLEQLANFAHILGYKGFCFSAYFKNEDQIKKLQEEIEKVKRKAPIEIYLGFEARNQKEIEKLKAFRSRFDVMLVHGGDLEINRFAVETPEVDILTHPEAGRIDSGLNDVMVKLAAKNNVAIELNLRQVLIASKNSRAKILRNISHNMMLAKKFSAPIAVCSGAISHFELRDPQILISFASLFGIEIKEAKDSLSRIPESGLGSALERKDKNWVMPGVRVLK